MDDTTTLGAYLRAERERRDLALKTISEITKVSLPLLEGLESDDISRWPGGIFRRAFVRWYADAVGLDPDEIFKRFERQHRPPTVDGPFTEVGQPPADVVALAQAAGVFRGRSPFTISRSKPVISAPPPTWPSPWFSLSAVRQPGPGSCGRC